MIYTSEKVEQVVLRISVVNSEIYQKACEKNCNGKLLPRQELDTFLLHLQQIQTFVTLFFLYYFIILFLNIKVIIL